MHGGVVASEGDRLGVGSRCWSNKELKAGASLAASTKTCAENRLVFAVAKSWANRSDVGGSSTTHI